MNIIVEYEQVLIGNRKQISPKNFPFKDSANQQIALTVFRYAIEHLLKWTPHEAQKLFTPEVVKKMKLDQLLCYIQFPCELNQNNTEYIVHLLYPRSVCYDFKKYVIDVYNKVLADEMRFPQDYMFGNKGLVRAKICLQYALKKHTVFHCTEDMYSYFSRAECLDFLMKKKLYQLYSSFYETPIDYLHYSLPSHLRNDLYYNLYKFAYAYRLKYRTLPPGIPEKLPSEIQEKNQEEKSREKKDGDDQEKMDVCQ